MKTDLVKKIEKKVKLVLQKHHVKRGGLFGSIVTGDFTDKSDVDLLVELADGTGLLEFIQIKQELEDVLQMPVDLVEYAAIKPLLQKSILKQEIRIYG
jgi:uncharacterized protein